MLGGRLPGLAPRGRGQLGPGVHGRRPDDRPPIAARDQEKALSDGRGAEVGGQLDLPFHHVAALFQPPLPEPERLALALRIGPGLAVRPRDQRAPVQELGHVLEEDDVRRPKLGHMDRDPSQAADARIDRDRPLGRREVAAVGREPRRSPAATRQDRPAIDVKDVRHMRLGVGVIDLVDRQRQVPMIDGAVRVLAQGHPVGLGRSSQAGEIDHVDRGQQLCRRGRVDPDGAPPIGHVSRPRPRDGGAGVRAGPAGPARRRRPGPGGPGRGRPGRAPHRSAGRRRGPGSAAP